MPLTEQKLRELDERLPKPEPSSGLAAYEAELRAALEFDPRRKANYDRYVASCKRNVLVDYLPIKLDIENVSRCNFACDMCIVKTWNKGRRASDMSLVDFKKIIDEQYGLVEIKLNGLGEPLLQGDDYFEMIRYARSKKIWVRITTNASLLHVKDSYRKLIDSGVNEIDISVDGTTKRTYEAIRRRGNFETLVRNCKLLNDYTNSLGICRTKMWTVVQRDNFCDIGRFVNMAHELGFKHLVLSLTLHGWANDGLFEENFGKIVENKMDQCMFDGIVEQGRALNVKVSFWTVSRKFDTGNPAAICPWPFERAVITSDLRVVPCCMIGNPDSYEIQHGIPFDFNAVWHGDGYLAFRQAHLSGAIPRVCKNCYK